LDGRIEEEHDKSVRTENTRILAEIQ